MKGIKPELPTASEREQIKEEFLKNQKITQLLLNNFLRQIEIKIRIYFVSNKNKTNVFVKINFMYSLCTYISLFNFCLFDRCASILNLHTIR